MPTDRPEKTVPVAGTDAAAADLLMAEAMRVVDAIGRRGGLARLTGGLAARRYAIDHSFMDREFSDIDLVAPSRDHARLKSALTELGYVENHHVSQATAGAQLQYLRPGRLLESRSHMVKRPHPADTANVARGAADHVDVFLDVMRMDHDVDVRGRLDIDRYALSPADVLLSKLQIGQPAGKDVHDVIGLLKDLPLGEADDNVSIDVRRLAVACAGDWGLWFDVTANLRLVAACLDDYGLAGREQTRVEERLASIAQAIARQEKSLRFRLRARFGTRLPWRREIEERDGPPAMAPPTAA